MEEYLQAIVRGDDDATERLVQQLTAGDEDALMQLAGGATDVDKCWWAVRGLAEVGTMHCLPILEACLSDPDGSIRSAAAMALGKVVMREPAPEVAAFDAVAALLSDPDGLVRQAAADTLAQCGNPAVPALVNVLRTSNHEGARTRAAGALRKIGTMQSAAALYPLLNDPNHLVRSYAYEGLDELGLLENVLVVI